AQAYWKGSFTHGNKSNHPDTGLLTYFLPLQSGGHKAWASETEDFFCCHGSLVQANAAHNQGIYYHDETRFAICQYLSSKTSAQMDGADVCITQKIDALTGSRNISSVQDYSQKINAVAAEYPHNPKLLVSVFDVSCSKKASFKLLFRIPWWCFGEYTLLVDGKEETAETNSEGFIALDRAWEHNTIELRFNKPLSSVTLRDKPDMVALMDGPVVLAGLCDEERVLYGDPKHPEDILVADNEREWSLWQNTYRTTGQDRGIRFVPLYQVGYEAYSVYFPIRQSSLT
ncbi:glycoside hydrolase family 127 protein, partial [Eubacteriales bacterium OttesenSCG-928-N13]|nr:glycoside hydrolase family 127 protein [Eubacteriales bacterium OttesenSCG-928-N13]